MSTPVGDAYPVAYCAPGKRAVAALTLMLKGEHVADVREHPWLEGHADVLIVKEPPALLIDPGAFAMQPRLPCLWENTA